MSSGFAVKKGELKALTSILSKKILPLAFISMKFESVCMLLNLQFLKFAFNPF